MCSAEAKKGKVSREMNEGASKRGEYSMWVKGRGGGGVKEGEEGRGGKVRGREGKLIQT